MITLQFPDGSKREFDAPVTVSQVLKDLGSTLRKSAIAAKINGVLVDLSHTINENAELTVITDQDKEGLEVLRHSTAHLLAYAVKTLFPDAKVTIGPVIENGFYYDFSYRRSFTPEDLQQIEKKMNDLVRLNEPVQRKVWSKQEAIAYFQSIGENYKVDIINSLPDSTVSIYTMGNFTDLCRGPHVPSTGKLKIFKLMKVAGAYWRGDAQNEMLQRIYGTAWSKKEDQDAYLHQLEEAEKRDHRKLGRALDLFHFQDEAPGLVFWHPKGRMIWLQIESYLRDRLNESGYKEIKTPAILDKSLWERSGHWHNYRENMFVTESEKRDYAVKPMNCPGHVQVFNHGLHSYRDLPLRFSEFGSCIRNEPSGALHGLLRVREFVQDDAHIFCMEEQIVSEVEAFNRLALSVYQDFGFKNVVVKLSLRPEKRAGRDEMWDRSEENLRRAMHSCGLKFDEQAGEGAFYGPKVEYHIEDAIGRSWQCGTLQLDFYLPEQFGAEYVTEDNHRKRPVMLHRAILGSFERFIGILLENYGGALPLWLSPDQIVVQSISDSQVDYAEKVADQLKKSNFRAFADTRNEKISYKIREHALQKVPYLLIVGEKEKNSENVSVRERNNDLGAMSLSEFIERLQKQLLDKR